MNEFSSIHDFDNSRSYLFTAQTFNERMIMVCILTLLKLPIILLKGEEAVKKTTLMLLTLMMMASASLAQQKTFKYTGSRACMPCHLTPKSGAAFKIWQESKHSKAFATLATPAALEVAKKNGIADPQKADACLKCHLTAHGVAAAKLAPTFKPDEGVGCEVCHGPGSEYKIMATMKAIDAGTMKGESVGLIRPDEKTCLKCHNAESPTFKGFNFAEFSAKIAHPTPKPK